MQELLALVEANPALKEKIEELGASGQTSLSADEVVAMAKEMGIDTSALDNVVEGELSEDELLAVNGGGSLRLCGSFGLVINY